MKIQEMGLSNTIIDQMNSLGRSGSPFLFIIDFEGREPMVYRLDAVPGSIRFTLPGYADRLPSSPALADITLTKTPMAYSRYLDAFQKVMHHLRQGNSYLVNLTFPTPVLTGLTLEEIYQISEAPYKLLVRDRFVVFSPETFVRIKGQIISSYPMKGTIDASLPDAPGLLLGDPKEAAEHTTIVDLIRNDLSQVADHVQVSRYRYLEKISVHDKEILQASSEITGILPDDYRDRIGSVLASLLPAGSISGAPKKKTVEIIAEAEQEARGFYTGVFGIFDGHNLDSAVMIRFIEKNGPELRYRSGGGITHLSQPEAEYREMLDKVYLQVSRDA